MLVHIGLLRDLPCVSTRTGPLGIVIPALGGPL